MQKCESPWNMPNLLMLESIWLFFCISPIADSYPQEENGASLGKQV